VNPSETYTASAMERMMKLQRVTESDGKEDHVVRSRGDYWV
jgi:hypothetical protein